MKRIVKDGNIAAIVLFMAGVLLFNWPLLSIVAEGDGFKVLLYVFLLWFAVIIYLGVHSYCAGSNSSDTSCREGDQ